MIQTAFDPNGRYFFVSGGAQIGGGLGGMKPLAQNGTVVITEDGTVALFGTKGDLIDQAPIAQVTHKKVPMTRGQTIYLTLGEKRYSVSLGSLASDIASGNIKGALVTGNSGARVSLSKQATGQLIEALESFPGRPL